MSDNRAFVILLRRLLTGLLVLAVVMSVTYLLLIRFNRASSYKRGLAAISAARAAWPTIEKNLASLRETIKSYDSPQALLDNQRFINSLDSLANKQRERINVDGLKVSIYPQLSVSTNHAHLVPIPGNTSLLKPDRDFWLPATVEVIAAQKDILLADFIAKQDPATWTQDPLEMEDRLNTHPGVLSCALMVNAPGGYERALAWLHQLLLMIGSFLLLFVPAYVWQDARGRYRNAFLWTSITAVTNIAGLLVYLLVGRVTTATCHECNQAVNDQQKFCPYCRVLLKTECLNCGQALGRNWRFCATCGAKPERE